MPSVNCKINFLLTWSANCVMVYIHVSNQGATFAITETKSTLSAQDYAKLLQQLKWGFKRTINWEKYLSKPNY